MRWRGADEGTSLILEDAPGRPAGLRLQSSPGRRLRIVREGHPVLWAKVESGVVGAWVLRRAGHTSLSVVDAIRAEEARAVSDDSAWLRWFAHALDASMYAPLGRGTWMLTAMKQIDPTLQDIARKRVPDVWFPQSAETHPGPAYGATTSWEFAPAYYVDWGINGSGDVLPLRDASPSDAGRVKSWRKHAAAGTLPPILLGGSVV